MELMHKCWILVLFFWISVPSQAASEADQVLEQIAADLRIGRLDRPALTNAMHRIDQFRQRWPFDFRILPLAYQWGDATLAEGKQLLAQHKLQPARQKAVQLWALVPLTPGLEAFQQQLDAQFPDTPVNANKISQEAVWIADYVAVDPSVHRQFRTLEDDNSPPLARLKLDAGIVDERDSDIEAVLQPLCQAMVEKEASAIIHAEDRVDYRWLIVRLTLCVRRVDRLFRLRHSFRQGDGAPVITLHPPRPAVLTLD